MCVYGKALEDSWAEGNDSRNFTGRQEYGRHSRSARRVLIVSELNAKRYENILLVLVGARVAALALL